MKYDKIILERPNKVIYKDGNNAIKLFGEDFSKIDVLNEALNQARVEQLDLNVPKIKEVTMIDGKWAIISEYIEGKTLKELMEEDPENYDEYMDLFVNVQLEILSKRCLLLNKIRDKMKRKISLTDLDETVKYDLCTRLDGTPRHNKLCHGDFNPANIIVTPEGKIYVIDWAHVTQGNASADAARTYLIFKLHKRDQLAEEYLELFCEKSGIKMRKIQRWMPIVAASQSVKGNEDERHFLLSWVDVADYY
jgi:RIO-like serine/threonine protein kinase